jgi:uncharacterized membrane protein
MGNSCEFMFIRMCQYCCNTHCILAGEPVCQYFSISSILFMLYLFIVGFLCPLPVISFFFFFCSLPVIVHVFVRNTCHYTSYIICVEVCADIVLRMLILQVKVRVGGQETGEPRLNPAVPSICNMDHYSVVIVMRGTVA